MTKSRKDIVLNEDEPSLLDVSLKNQDTIKFSLPASQSASDAIKVMSKLSLTCHTFHSLFKQQLDQQAAKKLCQHVVYGEKKEAEKLLEINPGLLLVKALVTDEAGRKIHGTAFQIALGAKDVSPFPDKFPEMVEMIAAYFKKIPDGEKEKQKQYAEQFPEGFEKLEGERQVRDLEALHTVFEAIKKSTTITQAKEAVNAFQAYLKKQTEGVIKTGYHFNDMLFEQALTLYNDNADACGGCGSSKNNLSTVKVLGGIQRYFTANLAQAACDGFGKVVDEKVGLSRSKLLKDKVTSFFNSKLGVDYFVYSFYMVRGAAWPQHFGLSSPQGREQCLKSYIEQKQQICKTYATTLANSKAPVCDYMMTK